jgi:hypothetical protein
VPGPFDVLERRVRLALFAEARVCRNSRASPGRHAAAGWDPERTRAEASHGRRRPPPLPIAAAPPSQPRRVSCLGTSCPLPLLVRATLMAFAGDRAVTPTSRCQSEEARRRD